MIVFKKTETGRAYSHIECDVPECKNVSPTADLLIQKSLFERGWFVTGGKHRCPDHYHEDTAISGPVERAADGTEGFVR